MQNKKRITFLIGVAVFLVIYMLIQQMPSGTKEDDFAYTAEESAITELDNSVMQAESFANQIVVHVAGAVQNPGVYTLQQGQRVDDALQAAGIAPDADIDALNRAAVLADGQKIIVPLKGEIQPDAAQEHNDGLVSINQADLQQLMTLPGIGEVKAQAILDYRTQHGSFSSIDEIKQVSGIGEAIFGQIKNKIKI